MVRTQVDLCVSGVGVNDVLIWGRFVQSLAGKTVPQSLLAQESSSTKTMPLFPGAARPFEVDASSLTHRGIGGVLPASYAKPTSASCVIPLVPACTISLPHVSFERSGRGMVGGGGMLHTSVGGGVLDSSAGASFASCLQLHASSLHASRLKLEPRLHVHHQLSAGSMSGAAGGAEVSGATRAAFVQDANLGQRGGTGIMLSGSVMASGGLMQGGNERGRGGTSMMLSGGIMQGSMMSSSPSQSSPGE